MKNFDKTQKIRLAVVLVLAVGLYGILPQFGSFKGSFKLIGEANVKFALLALATTFSTFISGVMIYRSLSMKPLPFKKTLIVQLAATFVNRLLPSGVGALGVNTAYLHKMKHTISQSVLIVGVNNLLGVSGHLVLLLCTYIFWSSSTSFDSIFNKNTVYVFLGLATLLGVILLLVSHYKSQTKIKNIKKQLKALTSHYRSRPQVLMIALLWSMTITLGFTVCLWWSLRAVGVELSLPSCLLVLTLGVGAGAAIPTPGGLGGVEAGIYAGLISLDVDAQVSLAGVLLYRILSYWLPLLVGFVAFVYVQKKDWLGFKF